MMVVGVVVRLWRCRDRGASEVNIKQGAVGLVYDRPMLSVCFYEALPCLDSLCVCWVRGWGPCIVLAMFCVRRGRPLSAFC